MDVPGSLWMSTRELGVLPKGSQGTPKGLGIPLRGGWGCHQGVFCMPPKVSGTLLVCLILLTSLPDLQESRRGLGGH